MNEIIEETEKTQTTIYRRRISNWENKGIRRTLTFETNMPSKFKMNNILIKRAWM